MRIAWSGRHTPYAYMFMCAFPEIEFVTHGWGEVFRPIPKNTTVVDALSGDFDVVITDYWDFSTTTNVTARRTVFLDHCEYNQPSEVCQAVLDRVDAFVCVSEHKLWTHRELAMHPKMRWIWFCFDGEMWPARPPWPGASCGFVHNMVRGEQVDIANNVFDGFEGFVIGHHNEAYTAGHSMEPKCFDDLVSHASTLSAAVNIVQGDSCGMAPLELMAMGVPVIFGLSADLPRFLFSGYNCLITNNRIGDSIPEARLMLTQLLRDPAMRERIGREARRTVLRELSVDSFRAKWSEVLQLQPNRPISIA